jgi:hypothetical protein
MMWSMTRRHLLLATTLAAALLVVTAMPAGAIPPFGPVVTVAPAPAGCTIDSANGDATDVSGVIRGFFNFSGPGCDADDIWFVGGFGTTWKVLLTPYQGRVLASDQSGGAFVLFSASTGIYLGQRSLGNGTYLDPPRQLSPTAPGAVPPQGTVLAGPSNTWWAVWTEARTQVTSNPDNDSQPALAFRPGGGGELVFVRDDGFGNEPTHSWLRLATASGNSGAWAGSQFATIGINTDPSIDTTPAPPATPMWPGSATDS